LDKGFYSTLSGIHEKIRNLLPYSLSIENFSQCRAPSAFHYLEFIICCYIYVF
jgi:hypothetical protein